MHVVGVPVATGYKRGLSKQVAKTKVFDQKRLETIQDQMHDFVEQQMKDHPEIFGDETLKPKEKGRNSDFSKEFYLRLKQQEYEKLEDKCQEKETQIEALDDTAKEMKQDIESKVDQYVDSVVNSEMKKEFMRYATLENPKTTLGKIVSKVAEKARTSLLQKLRENQAIVDQRKEQQGPNLKRNNLSPER